MTFPAPPDTELLDRYLANVCTPDERTAIDAWAAASPESALRLAALGRVVAEPFGPVVFTTPVEVRRRVWRAVDAAEHQKPPLTLIASHPRHRMMWVALSGVALGVMALVAGWRRGITGGSAHRPVAVSAYVTGNGERAHIMLPDSNTVALDVASRLEVPADYLTGDHTLRLSGEALFTVRHHAGIPFTVLAGQTTTRVLGTSFMVRHYATDAVTTVAVQEGKVAVGSAIVTKNRLIEVRGNGATEMRPAGRSQFSFASGILTLDNLQLPEAILALDRWYDADIRLGDPSLASRGVSGTCAPGSLADLAANLEVTLHVRVVRDGRVLTLYPRR